MNSRKSAPVAAALLVALALAFQGCTNNLFKSASQALNSGVSASNPFSGTGGGGSGAPLTLARVVKDNTDPNATLDLFDDGSGAMQQFCTPSQGGAGGGGAAGPNDGPTTCSCHFSYIKSNGSTEEFDMPTTYHERDQIRCSYQQIPGSVPFVKVSVHLTNADVFSNQITFRFIGTGVNLDLANPNSFSQVQRYQCRDIVTIPYLFGGNDMYDPLLSSDPRYSYPLDFYSTNMGGTMAIYAANSLAPNSVQGQGAGGPVQGWDCPAVPNDTSAGMDLSLFSVYPDSSGSKQIYPPNGIFDRNTFFLAKARSGVFNVPVNAMGAPSLLTCDVNAAGAPQGCQLPTLGFGAQPVPSNNGESCPDSSVTIPAGFHWVKVWLFYMQMPFRQFPSSSTLLQLNQIACNPGPWDPSAPSVVPYPDCLGKPILGASGGGLAARFSKGTGQCFLINPGWTTDPTNPTIQRFPASTTGPSITNDPLAVAPGTDQWNPGNMDPKFGCSSPTVNDAALTCYGDHVPKDLTPNPPGAIDDATNPRFDFLFVTSPPSVMAADMINTHSTVLGVYTPFRFMAPNDCMSSDPDVPKFVGDCSPARMLNRYALKLQDVGDNSDPSATSPGRTGVFPVCALQPN